MVAAALASLLFATGLVAFKSWPAAGGSSAPSVNLPAAAPASAAVPAGAAGRASAVIPTGPAIVLPAPQRRGPARAISRTGGRGGSAPTPAPAAGTPEIGRA